MSDKKETEKVLSPEEIQAQYQALRQENEQLQQKVAEMEGEKHEHNLVLKALEPLEDDRKCFRLIGTVLVEKKASEVKPALLEALKNIDTVVKKLEGLMEAKQKEISEFIEKYKMANTAARKAVEQPDSDKKDAKASQGVLA